MKCSGENGWPLGCASCKNNDESICVKGAKCLQAQCDSFEHKHECDKCLWERNIKGGEKMEKETVVVRTSQMKEDEFDFEVVAQGAYIDGAEGYQCRIETYTLRLNPIALNEWIMSETLTKRETFNTDQEWEDRKAKYAERSRVFESKIWAGLGIEFDTKGDKIIRSMDEVFTVVCVRKITDDLPENLVVVEGETKFMDEEEKRAIALRSIGNAIKRVGDYNYDLFNAALEIIYLAKGVGLITDEEYKGFINELKKRMEEQNHAK